MSQADADDGGGADSRLSGVDKRELAELRKEKRRLEVENEILKPTSLGRTSSQSSVPAGP